MTPYTSDLKEQIERILCWEQSSHWRLRDFMQLSKRILAHTNCWVEAHDLQTFWRSSETTPGLLDALAQFADYSDWTDFCNRNRISEMVPVKPTVLQTPRWEIPMRWVILICWLSVGASILIASLLIWKR